MRGDESLRVLGKDQSVWVGSYQEEHSERYWGTGPALGTGLGNVQ